MTTIELDISWASVWIFLVLLLLWVSSRASYWKARAETLQQVLDDESGWAEEARYWRRVYNKEAAESVEGAYPFDYRDEEL